MHSDLRDNCESAYDYVFHLICVMNVFIHQTSSRNSKE